MNYEKYIHRCIELARRGEYYVAPNPMVGAVLVRDSELLLQCGEKWYMPRRLFLQRMYSFC